MTTIKLASDEVAQCFLHANLAALGGKSQFRGLSDRQEHLLEDQLVGQLGNAALSKWWLGSIEPYLVLREAQNMYPWVGDGGSDLSWMKVDVKTSLMRVGPNPLAYGLIVGKGEVHPQTVYVSALLGKLPALGEGSEVLLTGWANNSHRKSDLVRLGDTSRFRDSYYIPVSDLRPLTFAPDPTIRSAASDNSHEIRFYRR